MVSKKAYLKLDLWKGCHREHRGCRVIIIIIIIIIIITIIIIIKIKLNMWLTPPKGATPVN